MNKKNTQYLLKKYPILYKQYYLPMQETCMCWGFMCEDGWFKLIDELSKKLIKLDKEVEAVEVKEKYGGLRFYMNRYSDKIHNLIIEYEDKSYTTCEECGQKGKIELVNNWYYTLCNKCFKKRLKTRIK